jgi:hypothetical protein
MIKSEAAMKKFTSGNVKTALADANKVMDLADPSINSEFFKLLTKFRESCTNAAQVKEILRIRTDKAAQKQVLDTYEAFVDFMRLADLEPEKENEAAA